MKTIMFFAIIFAMSIKLFANPPGNLTVDPFQETVALTPFKVKAPDLDIKIFFSKGRNNDRENDRIVSVVITHVVPGSAAEKMGITPGTYIHRIQKMDVARITRYDFRTKVLKQPVYEDFTMVLSKGQRGERYTVAFGNKIAPAPVSNTQTIAMR